MSGSSYSLDVDVIHFNELPLAEYYLKNEGLSYKHTQELPEVLLKSPKITGLTLTEINPDHGAEDPDPPFRDSLKICRADSLCYLAEE